MYRDEWVHLNGVWLHYQDWPAAAPGAEAVLLLHGLTQQSHVFDAVAARLARRHRCVALDLRGRGESGWAPGTYTMPHYVADVARLLEVLGLDAVHVVGTSLGGLIALTLAAEAPGRLRSLLLNDVGPEVDPRGAARVAAYAAAVPERFPSLEAAAAWSLARYPWLAALPPDEARAAIRWAVRRDAGGAWRLKVDPTIGRNPPPRPAAVAAAAASWWAAFQRLRCPILLVRGAESDILSAETAAAMQRCQPGMARLDLPGVGHAPTLAEPAVLAALERFYAFPPVAPCASS
jgi:pimeloyl-ACP methyl ester carboxylesterase